MTHLTPVSIRMNAEWGGQTFNLGTLEFDLPVIEGRVIAPNEEQIVAEMISWAVGQNEGEPRPHQSGIVAHVLNFVNAELASWGRGSGRTWTRRHIACALITDDQDAQVTELRKP